MQVFILIICKTLLYCICVESNSLFNDRVNDRSKSRYAPEEDLAVIDDPPPPVPYAAQQPAPYFYQRIAPYYYGDYYHPRQRYMRYMDDRPVKRSDYYMEPQRRQCRSIVRRRSANYPRNSYKLVPLRDEEYYGSDSNSPARFAGMTGNQDDAEHDEMGSEDSSSNSKFADDKYPTVLANFKIGSKLDKKSIEEPNYRYTKRASQLKEASSAIAKDKGGGVSSFDDIESDGKVAEELRDILDYMGLIDEDNNPNAKAAVETRDNSKKNAFEDENMEEGNNKISMTKEEKVTKDRSKREGKESTEAPSPSNTMAHLTDSNQDTPNKASSASKDADRSKRESSRTKRQDMNGTLSHKASLDDVPLVAEASNANDYEKRVERQIQSRINALKEEVKREIAALKAQEAAQAVHNLNDDTQRKKRQAVSTLIDEENSDLDPALHPDVALKPHIRKRRSIEETSTKTSQSKQPIINTTKPDVDQINDLNLSTIYTSNYTPNYKQNSTIKHTSYLVNLHAPAKFIGSNDSAEVTTETMKFSSYQPNESIEKHIANMISPNDSLIHTLRRKKRDAIDHNELNNIVPVRFAPSHLERSMAYVPERGEAADEEQGEMDYEGFYDTVRNIEAQHPYLRKRSIPYKQRNRRANTAIVARNPSNRRLRRGSYDAVAFHSGGPAQNQFSSLRSRNMASFLPRVRRRRAYSKRDAKNLQQPQTLSDMTDTDIFGALPQSYDGELNRFKRVRRS